ncbi:MAG TPA: hypothetical protein VGG39_21355 [Polyangiaceae bacterium]|jgi:hypothetical protein
MRRRVPALLTAAIFAACHAAPPEAAPPEAGAPPARAEAAAASASASASSAPAAPEGPVEEAGPSPVDDFCKGAFTADVDRMRATCSPADLGVSQSLAHAAADFCAKDFKTAVRRNRAAFDGDAARRCVEMLKAKALPQTSETDTLFQHFPCDRVLVGLQPEGQACRFSIECKDGLACVGYKIGVDGTCKKPPPAKQACTLQPYGTLINLAAADQHHPACASGAWCDGTTCQPRGLAGKTCATSSSCAAGLACVQGKCGLRAGVGAQCAAATDCAFGLWCNQGTCAARFDDGHECTAPAACKGRCDIPKKSDGRPNPAGKCVAMCGSG